MCGLTSTPIVAAVALAAKLALVALRVADGGGRGLASPWAPLVLVAEDAWLVLAFATAEAGFTWVGGVGPRVRRLARAALRLTFAAVILWIAINVPIARVFSTPATFSMLNASGTALADSVAVYLTIANLGVPTALIAAAFAADALARRRARADATASVRSAHRRAARLAASALVLVIVGVAGGQARARVPALGLHRNAVVTIATTTFAHLRADARDHATDDAATTGVSCDARDGRAADLRDLRGSGAGRNIVWVILESTAARFLTPYGATREVTPNLTALAGDAVVFDDAYAAYPESIKGLYSMLCARAPLPGREAAAHAQGHAPCVSLAASLRAAGYRTGFFHSGRFAYLGMRDVIANRGFDALEDGGTIGGAFQSSFGVDEVSTVRKLLAFVDGVPAGQRFFAVYSPIAGHHPYHAPGDGPRPFPEHTEADAYANDLFVGDAAFGQLREGLRRRGLDDRTLYVVVGDHGEAFFEHEGNFAHTLFLYEENVRVPFLVAAPGSWRGPRRAPQLASLVDIGPTLLDLLGLLDPGVAPTAGGGHSLLDPHPRLVRFFTDQGLPQSALRDGRWKLIADQVNNRARLYDLLTDPNERQDLTDREPARTAHYTACLGSKS